MGSPPEPADGRPRRRRPWGLLALAGVFVAFGVSEALGTQGTLAESSLQDPDRASSGETRTVEPGGGGNAPTAPGPSYDSAPGYPPLALPDDTPGDGGANQPARRSHTRLRRRLLRRGPTRRAGRFSSRTTVARRSSRSPPSAPVEREHGA